MSRAYSMQWHKVRAGYLLANPVCSRCESDGKQANATVVRTKRRYDDKWRMFDAANLEGLCECHWRKYRG